MTKQKAYSGSPDRSMPDNKPGHAGSTSSGMSKSMHDGVEVWCDCCSCEAEPYWVEAMQLSKQDSRHNKKKS